MLSEMSKQLLEPICRLKYQFLKKKVKKNCLHLSSNRHRAIYYINWQVILLVTETCIVRYTCMYTDTKFQLSIVLKRKWIFHYVYVNVNYINLKIKMIKILTKKTGLPKFPVISSVEGKSSCKAYFLMSSVMLA